MNNKRIVKIFAVVSTVTRTNTRRDAVLSCSSNFSYDSVFELPISANATDIEAAARIHFKIDTRDNIVVVDRRLDVD